MMRSTRSSFGNGGQDGVVADNAARKVALAHGLAAGGARQDRLLRLYFARCRAIKPSLGPGAWGRSGK